MSKSKRCFIHLIVPVVLSTGSKRREFQRLLHDLNQIVIAGQQQTNVPCNQERSKNYRDYKCRMLPHGTQGYPGRGRKGPHCHQGSIWCWRWHSNVKCGKISGFFRRVRPFIFFAIKVIKVARKPPWRCTATDFKVGLTYSTRPGRQIQDSLGGDVIGTTAKLVLHFSGLHTHLLFFSR